MVKGDKIFTLLEYHWCPATVMITPRANSKTVLVELEVQSGWGKYKTRVKIAKTARPDESVCVVWETYRGPNGGYRVERELYPEHRVPAHQVSHSHNGQAGRVDEDKPL